MMKTRILLKSNLPFQIHEFTLLLTLKYNCFILEEKKENINPEENFSDDPIENLRTEMRF